MAINIYQMVTDRIISDQTEQARTAYSRQLYGP